MAKKKRKATSRRRVGAVRKSGGIMPAVQILAGALAARVVTNTTGGIIRNDMIRSAVPAVIGVLLPRFVKGPVGQNIGSGMIVGAGLNLVSRLNLPLIGGAPFIAGMLPVGSAPTIAGNGMIPEATYTTAQAAYVS